MGEGGKDVKGSKEACICFFWIVGFPCEIGVFYISIKTIFMCWFYGWIYIYMNQFLFH